MMHRISVTLVLVIAALNVTASAASKKNAKTFTGTHTCLACDLKKLEGTNSECEAYGHKHCLRLDNGKYINFLENDHSEALIKGGGRHNTRITVTGIYNSNSHTIDIQSYVIDGIKTEWCEKHHQMDICASTKSGESKN
jgi:hypothetical protein